MLLDKLYLSYLANFSWLSNRVFHKGIPGGVSDSESSREFNWDNIIAHEQLTYHPCFNDFQCARLRVPLDWTDFDDNRTVELALIRLPATVGITDHRYGGPVIINPGGPGGSGVNLALKDAQPIQTLLSAGPETTTSNSPRHFDIISFDPRGVNNTTPAFTCFPDHIQATTFELESGAAGVFDSSEYSFGVHWAKVRAMASDCSKRAIESGIGEYMTTASVSRDIIEIVERHGEWREKEARNLLSSPSLKLRRGAQIPLKTEEDVATLERVKYRPGEELVQYWGFSYGTILGATLAAMFPERVSRLVLDGVADSFDYMKGGWLTNLQDTDLEIARFGEYCWLGGPKNCALYHEDGPAIIVENFRRITTDLKENPIGVPATREHGASVATYGDLKNFFKMQAYNPLKYFHKLAEIMSELSQGNGTGLIQSKFAQIKTLGNGLSEQCVKDGPYSKSCFNSTGEWDSFAGAGVLCTDSGGPSNLTKAEYWKYVEELIDQSKLIGDVWATIRLPCTQWNVWPKWRYEGNFTAKTAEPILFISNTVDNVTPIRNAVKMSKGFDGSVVLQQDSEGHCSAASPSFCTARVLREYFQTGKLPKRGTVCAPERLPLDGYSEEEEPAMPEGETDEEVWRAMVKLNKG